MFLQSLEDNHSESINEDEFDEVADKVKELMIANTLNIPLEVDMEICDPSWAIKKDVDEKFTKGTGKYMGGGQYKGTTAFHKKADAERKKSKHEIFA